MEGVCAINKLNAEGYGLPPKAVGDTAGNGCANYFFLYSGEGGVGDFVAWVNGSGAETTGIVGKAGGLVVGHDAG